MRYSIVLGLRFFSAALMGFALIANNQPAYADFADSPCDPKYYESLEARAWMEAQREITQNQNLIFKPDSVLEYTCFDGHLNELIAHAPDMFSENARWGDAAGDMDAALTNLIAGAMADYENNFTGTFLNGRSNITRMLPSNLSSGSYACQLMQNVWQQAKCMNFIDESSDGFFTLAAYAAGGDRRSGCSVDSRWADSPEEAYGSLTSWDEDNVVSYLDRLFPESGCGTGNTNRIKTGLIVETNSTTGPTSYEEHVCLAPGCYWEPTGLSAGSCQ